MALRSWFSKTANCMVYQFRCNQCHKVVQTETDELLKQGILTSFVLGDNRDTEVHFCHQQCRDKYMNEENKNAVV